MTKRRVWSDEEKEWLKENLRYDPDTGQLWWIKPRQGVAMSKPAGYVHHSNYVVIGTNLSIGRFCSYLAHRLAWFLHYGEEVDQLDHIDNDPANNKIENLRPATPLANSLNRRPWSASGYKGVYKSGNRWRARIQAMGMHTNLGNFDTEEEAAMAFDKKCEEYKRRYPELAVYFTTNKDLGLL